MIIILTIFPDEEKSNRGQISCLAAEASLLYQLKTFPIMPIIFLEWKSLETVEVSYLFLSSYYGWNSWLGENWKCSSAYACLLYITDFASVSTACFWETPVKI